MLLLRLAALTALLAAAIMAPAFAQPAVFGQPALDHTAEPQFGAIALGVDFSPDPLRIANVIGGGEIDANLRNLGDDCVGFIDVRPDFRVTAQTTFPLLRFIFIADTILTDTTLVIRDPSGRFLCNNNAFGLFNPMVSAFDAEPGDYAIWVGGFTPGAPVFGDLYLTTNPEVIPGSTSIVVPLATASPTPSPVTPTPDPAAVLDFSRSPAGGTAALSAGFLPDPYWIVLSGGGTIAVPDLTGQTVQKGASVLPECGGFTTPAPHFRLTWGGQSTRLRFHFVPAAEGADIPEASLVIRAPDGRWGCNRDFAPFFPQPSVEFLNPLPGDYHVWIADEVTPGTDVIGVLYITELATTPETVRDAATRAYTDVAGLDALSALASIAAGGVGTILSPDPYPIPGIVAGGPVDVGALNADMNRTAQWPEKGCIGHSPYQPNFTIALNAPLNYLRLFFVPDRPGDDPALIVRMPDGRWYCNDDSFDTLNPTVNIVGNRSTGVLQVWVATYDPGVSFTGTLYLTRGSANPTSPRLAPPAPTATPFVEAFPTLETLIVVTQSADIPALLPALLPDAAAFAAANPAGLLPLANPSNGSTGLGAARIPHGIALTAGGTLAAAPLGAGCAGYVEPAPAYRIEWTGMGAFLRFFFVGAGDAALIVLGPDGLWRCDDGASGLHPMVDVEGVGPGVYYIWVGSSRPGERIDGTLWITEDRTITSASG